MMVFKKLLLTGTAKDSFFVLGGAGATAVFGFLLTVLLTRNLNQVDFGLVVTALAFSQLVIDLSEFGINSAILAYLPKYQNLSQAILIKTSGILRLFIGIVMGCIVFIFAQLIAEKVFGSLQMVPYIQVSVIGIVLAGYITWGQTIMQSLGRFAESAMLNGVVSISRVLGITLLMVLGIVSALNSYIATQLVVIVPLIYIIYRFRKQLSSSPFNSTEAVKTLKFGLPLGLSFAVAAISTRLDQLLVFNLLSEEDAGFYGLSFRMAMLLVFVSSAIGAAITPRFASLEPSDFGRYFKKSLLAVALLALGTLILIPAGQVVIPLLFGREYSESIVPFQLLVVGMSIFILQVPFNLGIIYFFKKTHYSVFLSIGTLVLMWFGLNAFIPVYKITGAALTVVLVYIFQLIVMSLYFVYLLRKSKV